MSLNDDYLESQFVWDWNKYKVDPNLPYGKHDSVERQVYQTEVNRLDSLFWADFDLYFGIQDNPKRDEFHRVCWEYGHSSGYSEVVSVAYNLIDLIK